MKKLNNDQTRLIIQRTLEVYGTRKKACEDLEFSQQFICRIFSGVALPPKNMCEKLGIKIERHYQVIVICEK